MSTYLKPVLVLIVSLLLFAGIAYLADKELLDFIQTRFYNPSIINSYVKENAKDAEIVQSHIFDLQNKFASVLSESAVRSSFHFNQSTEDIYERSRIFGILLESTGGLQSVQFIDINGIRIHYSTSSNDIISRDINSTSYRNYTEDALALPFDIVSVPANGNAKFTMDEQSSRIIFSYPFTDSIDVYRGTALFNVSVKALGEKLVAEGRFKVNEDVSVIESPQGVIFGNLGFSKAEVLNNVSTVWSDSIQGRVTLDAADSGVKFSLISFKTNYGMFFGRLVNDAIFHISASMKNILYLSMFLTFYLALFFLTNFKTNSVTTVQNRIKRLRDNLFEQLYVNKTSQDRAKWILELGQRRDEIRLELKGNMRMTRRSEKTIDSIIDKSWNELLAVMAAGSYSSSEILTRVSSSAETTADEAELVEEILEAEEISELDEVEDFEEAGKIDEIKDFEEIEEIEEITEVEEANEIEEADEITSEAVESGDVTSIEEGLIQDFVTVVQPAEEPLPKTRRGLLALASELEFNRDYSVVVDETTEVDDQFDSLDIVSPFSSMFSSLHNVGKNGKVKRKRKPSSKNKGLLT